MNNGAARSIPEDQYFSQANQKPFDPQPLFVKKDTSTGVLQDQVQTARRFRGDILVYCIAIGLWIFGTVWMVIKLIDKFF